MRKEEPGRTGITERKGGGEAKNEEANARIGTGGGRGGGREGARLAGRIVNDCRLKCPPPSGGPTGKSRPARLTNGLRNLHSLQSIPLANSARESYAAICSLLGLPWTLDGGNKKKNR